MLTDSTALTLSAVLTWLMLLLASFLRNQGWTRSGLRRLTGNREQLPEPTALSGRAERAAKNMLENLLLLVALVVAARAAGADPHSVSLGASVFFWARVLYAPVYLGGISVLRTFIWLASIVGLGIIAAAALA